MEWGITERELESIRAEQLKFMPTPLQVYRKLSNDTDSEFVKYGPEVNGRLTPNLGSLWRGVADRYEGLTMFSLTGPLDWDIKAGDQVYDAYGRVYVVRDVKDPATYHTALQCLAEQVD